MKPEAPEEIWTAGPGQWLAEPTNGNHYIRADKFDQLREERDDLQRTFDIRWQADMRAIKRWQEATGRTMTWPDHADLCVWLMEQLEAAEWSPNPKKVAALFRGKTDDA